MKEIKRKLRRLIYWTLIVLTVFGISSLLVSIGIDYRKIEKENIELKDTLNIEKESRDLLSYQRDSLKAENEFLKSKLPKSKIPNDLNLFLYKLSLRESGNNQFKVSENGMLGKYQFKQSTLRSLGINVSKDVYLNSSDLQDYSAIAYMKQNKKILNEYITKYNGKYHNGVKITTSGILAGAHLTGPGGVIEFFTNEGKYNTVDKNDVHVVEYIKEFSGYNILNNIK